jgi:hypothetical protein
MIGLTMKLGLGSAGLLFAPHQLPAPPVVATPIASVQATPGPEVKHSPPPVPVPIATTTTTVYAGLECVVTLTDSLGNTMTYSPGPAVNGTCALGTPEPVTATS